LGALAKVSEANGQPFHYEIRGGLVFVERLGNLLKLWLDNDVRTYKLNKNDIEKLMRRMNLERVRLKELLKNLMEE